MSKEDWLLVLGLLGFCLWAFGFGFLALGFWLCFWAFWLWFSKKEPKNKAVEKKNE